jgi:hypothetical protein
MRKRPELAQKQTRREPPGVSASSNAVGREVAEQELRCGCGSLMVRRRGDIIELKCRRCRRCHHLRLLPGGEVVLTEAPPSPVTEDGHDPE